MTAVPTLDAVAADVQAGGGSTQLIARGRAGRGGVCCAFDRSDDYAALLDEIRAVVSDRWMPRPRLKR